MTAMGRMDEGLSNDHDRHTKQHTHPPPLCESNALVGTTVGVVSATFQIVSYFALYKYAPLSEQRQALCPSTFRILVLLSQGAGGGGWAEPRMTAWSQCSVKHPGHHAGAHTTGVNHEAHATRTDL